MAPETSNNGLTGFGGDVWYLAITFYSLIHPQRYNPWSDVNWKIDNIPRAIYIGLYNAFKIKCCRKKRNALPESVKEF